MEYKLSELVTIKYGKNQSEVVDIDGKYPILGTGGIIGYSNQYLYNKPSVLIGRKGSIKNVKYIDKPFWTIDTLFYTIINENIVIPKYLFYKLSQSDLSTYNEGSAVPSLTTATLNQIKIEIPSLKEQKRIADILTALDDKIELNNQMNQTLEEIASLLYKRWFVDFEFPDDKGNPYKSSGGEMVDSELGMIPKGWEVKELGEVLEISSGNRPVQKSEEKTKENIFPIVGASKIMGYTNNYILDDTNEVLIIGRVGTLGIIQEYREKIWVSDNTLIIKSNFQNYIKQYLSNVDFYSLNSGSTQPLITQTTINKLLIVVPCNKVTDKFEKIESSNVRIKFCNTYEIKKIQRLKLELLKELI